MNEPEHVAAGSLVPQAFSRKSDSARSGRARRAGRHRADQPIRRTRPRGAGPRVHLSLPDPDRHQPARSTAEDYQQFQRWSIFVLCHHNRNAHTAASAAQLLHPDPYHAPAARPHDLISGLAKPRSTERGCTEGDLLRACLLLPAASKPRTARWETCCSVASPTRPADGFRDHRSLIPQAIEEAVRSGTAAAASPGWRPTTPSWPACRSRRARRSCRCSAPPNDKGPPPIQPLQHLPRPEPHISSGHGARSHRNAPRPAARCGSRSTCFSTTCPPAAGPNGDDPRIRGQSLRSPTSLPVLLGSDTTCR